MRVIVELREPEFRKLQEQALDERRSVREQAGWLLAQALKAQAEQEGSNEQRATTAG